MNSINTNLGALTAQKNMHSQNQELSQAMARLSSGLRINSAADDAAGSAIASKMEAQVRSLDVAIRNSYDAISMTQTAEGALGEMENILQRVRELAVQSSNSTLSNNDRNQLQNEVNQLIAEVDKIAATTHFNNVKLLDGTNADVTFQIGINAENSLKVNLEQSNSVALGLSGSKGVSELTSERVSMVSYTTNQILASDVKINGFDAFSTTFTTDLSSATTNTAKGYADAINLNTGVHGAEVNAFNTLTSDAVGTFRMAGNISINGDTIAIANSYEDLVSKINEEASGVKATLNSNDTITLSNVDGANITIAEAASGNAASVGFTVGDYNGFLSITNLDGSGVTIEAGSETNGYKDGAGTIADVQSLGFNEFSKAGVIETDVVSGTKLSANELKINDVLIGQSVQGSADSIAAAINEQSSLHGVTANASNEIILTLDFDAAPSKAASFSINGTAIDMSGGTSAAALVTAVESAGIGDIKASLTSDGTVKLSSASGVDIVVANADNDFITGVKNIHGDAITTGLTNGTYDLDGLLDGVTATAVGNLNFATSSFVGEVVNSRVVLTQNTTNAYDASSAVLKVTGVGTDGLTLTEGLTFDDPGAASPLKQIQGTSVFHKITNLEITGGAVHASSTFDVGLNGKTAGASTDFDDDYFFSTIGATAAAGDLTLLTTDAIHGGVITFSTTGDYTSTNAVTFTVTGTDIHGSAVTEDIVYNVKHGEIHGSTVFHQVSKITASAATKTGGMEIGFAHVGDRVEAKGAMTLTNAKGTPIQIEAVGEDHDTNNKSGGSIDTIMQKLGVLAQGQAFEVTGTGVDVGDITNANSSLALIDDAIDQLSLFRSSFGAVENRIDASINNLTTLKVNTQAAQSRIQDADFANETSKMTKAQILSQAATSMLAQANASKQNLLALLQG